LLELQGSLSMSMILITHDLGLVADIAHDVLVMYAGLVMEHAPAAGLFAAPLHPYSQALLATIPSLDKKRDRLQIIAGEVPNPMDIPTGCPFHPRCPQRMPRCSLAIPPLLEPQAGHLVRCVLYE
jgi:oligopeptide/dipeptide ABC transporter ATP-binding protein